MAAYTGPHGGPFSNSTLAVSQYLGRGPYTGIQLPPLQLIVANGKSGPLECTLKVFVPQGRTQQRSPLVVLSAGFLLNSGLYGSYAADLTSWGLAVALYDLPEIVDDMVMVGALGSILDACTSDPRVSPHVDARAILLAGHSRGAKLSVLAAAGDPRVRGLGLLDPVDVTAMTPSGPGYPSALPAMRIACGPPRSVPALVVGAARNTDVIPANANYKRFVSSCPGTCWSLELQGAGHLQFLDARVDLLSMFVDSGPVPDEAVRAASKAALTAWALELAVPLARGELVAGPQVAERLRQTAAAIQRQTPVTSDLKGFEQLGTSAGNSGNGAGRSAAGTAPASSAGGWAPYGGGGSGEGGTGGTGGSEAPRGARKTGSAAAASAGSGTAGASASGPTSSATSPAAGGGAGNPSGGGKGDGSWSYEALMGMRARELKAILVERGVDCSDCFEKEDLAKRIVERC